MNGAYSKPPVIEGVVELQFQPGIGEKVLRKLRSKFSDAFPKVDEHRELKVEIGPTGGRAQGSFRGYKLTSFHGTEVLNITSNAFNFARLAPYTSWDDLTGKYFDHYDIFRRVVGQLNVTRAATRFVNRIDIPDSDVNGQLLTKFFKGFLPFMPADTPGQMNAFFTQTLLTDTVSNIKTQINFQSVAPPPLISMTSFIFDIDVFIEGDLPQSDQEIKNLVNQFRAIKNERFESVLTDETRKLFG